SQHESLAPPAPACRQTRATPPRNCDGVLNSKVPSRTRLHGSSRDGNKKGAPQKQQLKLCCRPELATSTIHLFGCNQSRRVLYLFLRSVARDFPYWPVTLYLRFCSSINGDDPSGHRFKGCANVTGFPHQFAHRIAMWKILD